MEDLDYLEEEDPDEETDEFENDETIEVSLGHRLRYQIIYFKVIDLKLTLLGRTERG